MMAGKRPIGGAGRPEEESGGGDWRQIGASGPAGE